ncbi:unnamed protein product [Orchesella dallaii]|uniref:BTB domain-containing protein n=1 Tax=Orchesella dallaii TaxID=48710 RepID=A0ABP1RRY6_9HEXA
MKVILAQNQRSETFFHPCGLLNENLRAEWNCTINLKPGGDGDLSHTAYQLVQRILQEWQVEEFTVVITVKNPAQPSQRIEGSVQGEIFYQIFLGLDEQPLTMKLHVGLVSNAQWKKDLVTQEVPYLSEEPENQVAFKFSQDLPRCWWPTEGYKFTFEVTAELIFKLDLNQQLNEIDPVLIQMNRKFPEEASLSDFTLITANGTYIPCHKMFLQGCSNVFSLMIDEDEKKAEAERLNSFKLGPSSTREGVVAMLKYVYYRELKEPKANPKVALELLALAHEYQIQSLETVMKDILLEKPVEWWNESVEVLFDLLNYTLRLTKSGEGEGFEYLMGRALDILNL